MIGKVFDQTASYAQNPLEVGKLVDYYFSYPEIKNKAILDTGCRVGDYTRAFIDRGAGKVVGIDLSHNCIESAKRKILNKKVKFYQGDISRLNRFPSGCFDVVFCTGTICYLSPAAAKIALDEFRRVVKPGGIILVLFQKEKSWLIKMITQVVNLLPIKLYLFLIEHGAHLILPLVIKMIGRKIGLNYLKYDILLSLRGLHFGIPIKIDEKFRVKTIKCEMCSEETTASYKIKLPFDKKLTSVLGT